jgi:protein SCO1
LKNYARPLFILAATMFGAALTYLILFYAVGPNQNPTDSHKNLVPIIPILVPNPSGGTDSTIKVVGDFTFTNQMGDPISRADLQGKIWVADVFFTTCQGICPQLSAGFQKVQSAFAGDPEVKLVSFTVDPEYDSISVMHDYGKLYGADNSQWYFLTGNKTALYEVETEEFFFSHTADEDQTVKFVHDGKVRLIDKEGRFRGTFYDGLDPLEVDSLIADIKRLKNEYAQIQ